MYKIYSFSIATIKAEPLPSESQEVQEWVVRRPKLDLVPLDIEEIEIAFTVVEQNIHNKLVAWVKVKKI